MEEQRRAEEELYRRQLDEERQRYEAMLVAQAAAETEATIPETEGVGETSVLQDGSRKRRRAAVDYAALSEKLFGSANGTTETTTTEPVDDAAVVM